MPYNYTLAFRNSTEGLPLMRPLFFEEPDNFRLYSVSQTYLWGNDFLVSPVLQEHVTEQEVYFPKGSNWFNFYSGEKYKGGSTAGIELQEEYIPTFVRGGAIIPMAKPMQTTQNFSAQDIELHYFFDPETETSSGSLFHDDGVTPGTYEKGTFEILNFESKVDKNEVTFSIIKNLGAKQKASEFRKLEVIVHHLNAAPKSVRKGSEKIKTRYDREKKLLVIPVNLDTELTKIKITN